MEDADSINEWINYNGFCRAIKYHLAAGVQSTEDYPAARARCKQEVRRPCQTTLDYVDVPLVCEDDIMEVKTDEMETEHKEEENATEQVGTLEDAIKSHSLEEEN